MPTVKWVGSWYDGPTPSSESLHIALSPFPVLTLDDLEAWLKINAATNQQAYGNADVAVRNRTIDDLLAQVQAMRGEQP